MVMSFVCVWVCVFEKQQEKITKIVFAKQGKRAVCGRRKNHGPFDWWCSFSLSKTRIVSQMMFDFCLRVFRSISGCVCVCFVRCFVLHKQNIAYMYRLHARTNTLFNCENRRYGNCYPLHSLDSVESSFSFLMFLRLLLSLLYGKFHTDSAKKIPDTSDVYIF